MRRPQWDDYEEAVMAGRGEEAAPPGEDYVMSEEFRQWLLARMRTEVLGDVERSMGAVQPKMRKKA